MDDADPTYEVTGEEVTRGDEGEIQRLTTKHYDGGQRYWTVIVVDDGRAEFDKFAPVDSSGRTITSSKKIDLLDTSKVTLVDFEKTMALLEHACRYAREVHDLEMNRSIWLARYGDSRGEGSGA